MRHCIIRNSKVLKFIISLLIIGLLTGIILYLNLSKETKDIIINSLIDINKNIKTTNQNNITFHLTIISVFILLSLTLILYPITIFYIFYETLSYGFILAYYFHNYKLGGILYSFVYFLLNKAFFILILIYISFVSLKLIKKIINALRKKDNISVRELYQNYFFKVIICSTSILIFDIIIYFLGNKILSIFQFLL